MVTYSNKSTSALIALYGGIEQNCDNDIPSCILEKLKIITNCEHFIGRSSDVITFEILAIPRNIDLDTIKELCFLSGNLHTLFSIPFKIIYETSKKYYSNKYLYIRLDKIFGPKNIFIPLIFMRYLAFHVKLVSSTNFYYKFYNKFMYYETSTRRKIDIQEKFEFKIHTYETFNINNFSFDEILSTVPDRNFVPNKIYVSLDSKVPDIINLKLSNNENIIFASSEFGTFVTFDLSKCVWTTLGSKYLYININVNTKQSNGKIYIEYNNTLFIYNHFATCEYVR